MTTPRVALGDVVDVLSGFAFESERFGREGELPVVRIRDVVPGRSSTYYSGDYDPRYVVRDGDILIGMDGEFNRSRWVGGKALLNQRVCKIEPSNGSLDAGYLFHFLPAALKAIEDLTPFVTVKHLSAKSIREIPIALPPMAEQRRIAAILDQADALRAKRRAAMAQLDTLAQSIFFDMFGDPATNPKGWVIKTVGDISFVRGGKRLPKGEPYSQTPTRFRYIRVTDLKGGEIDESELVFLAEDTQAKIARYVVHPGDVVVSIAGTIGLIAPVTVALDGVNLTENAAKLTPKRLGVYTAEFLADFLRTPYAQRQLASQVGQVTIGKLALFRIERVRVPIPPLALQNEYCLRRAGTKAVRTKAEVSGRLLNELFASLQHRAFRGEL